MKADTIKRKSGEKIVRDKTLETAKEHHNVILTGDDYRYCIAEEAVLFLIDRWKEHSEKLVTLKTKEERVDMLADMSELMMQIIAKHGFPFEMVADYSESKRNELGSFDKNLIVDFDKIKQ